MYPLVRTLLFLLPPEWAHLLTLRLVRLYGQLKQNFTTSNDLEPTQRVGNLRVSNRLGIAAGFDKDGVAVDGLIALGFGFIEVGAVTPLAQPGNSKPRLFRLRKDRALINRMGFNNDGVDALVERLRQIPRDSVPLGVNIGKNTETPTDGALDDYLYCLERVFDIADFVTVNLSSPNTPGLQDLLTNDSNGDFLQRLVERRNELAKQNQRDVSLFLKISPDWEPNTIVDLARQLERLGYDGVIATNTSAERDSLISKSKTEPGGLSGQPLYERVLGCVSALRKAVSTDFTIIGSGGISDRASAQKMFDAGADLVQIYTGLVYDGPSSIRKIKSAEPRNVQSA